MEYPPCEDQVQKELLTRHWSGGTTKNEEWIDSLGLRKESLPDFIIGHSVISISLAEIAQAYTKVL
jgi:hypothetical protein